MFRLKAHDDQFIHHVNDVGWNKGEDMAIQKNNFREQLVDMVKAAGQEVVDRAEELVGQGELMTNFDIWLRFPLDGRMFTGYPTIEVTKSYVNKKSCDVMFEEAK